MGARRTVNRWIRVALVALALAGATGAVTFGDAAASTPTRSNYWCNRC